MTLESSWGPSLPLAQITKFAYDIVLETHLWLMLLQGAISVGNKVEDLLSRIVVLENHLDSCPSDVVEQRRRDELCRCVAIFRFRFSAEFLSASLKTSKSNCCPWLRTLNNAPKGFTGSLRIFERLY